MEFITIKNELGMKVTLCNIGAGLFDIIVPDRDGNFESVLAHPHSKKEYCFATSYFGKPCGRTAGRISDGQFTLGNKLYYITKKPKDIHALHGGIEGISYKKFDYHMENTNERTDVIFTYLSKDMEGGYPGNLAIKITYSLAKKSNTLSILFDCNTDKETLCNLTNHAYFNLSGNVKRDVLNQELFINASTYGFVNEKAIPSELKEVSKEFDFRKSHAIGDYINSEVVVQNTNGYDHPFLFDSIDIGKPNVILSDKESGRTLEISSTYESVVVYTCNYPEHVILPNGKFLRKNEAICLELQHFPNTINSYFLKNKQDILSPNNRYLQQILFNFQIN